MSFRKASTCALVGALFAATGAQAQDIGGAAQARFDEGVRAYDRGDFETARRAFLETRRLTPRVSVLRNLAQSELKTGHPLDALNHFREYVADPSIPREKRDRAVKALAEAYQQTGHLVVTTEPSARVLVDGAPVVAADGVVDVTAGSHDVEARAGARHAMRTVQAAAGALTQVDLPLPPATPEAPTAITSPASATPPAATMDPSAGSGASGASSARWVTAGAIGAVGVAGLVLGGVFASKAASAQEDVEHAANAIHGVCHQGSAACDALSQDLDDRNHDRNAEVVGFLVGGGLVAASVVTALVWPRSRSASARSRVDITSRGLSFTF